EGFQDVLSSFGPITVTAWNGHARLGPLTLPNVLVVLAGIAAIVITWLAARGIWKSPRWLPFALAGYGLAHTGYVLISMMVAEEARPQIGAFLSTAAFAGM